MKLQDKNIDMMQLQQLAPSGYFTLAPSGSQWSFPLTHLQNK